VITPPDVVSQFALALPLLALFEGTLLLMRFNESRAARLAAKEAAEESADAEETAKEAADRS
jgi:sec-independent protein translocase protein TatC